MKNLIICAAIKLTNGKIYRGHRHSDCILTAFNALFQNKEKLRGRIEGFMTSENIFVDRKEAMMIARVSGQVVKEHDAAELYSEDLY